MWQAWYLVNLDDVVKVLFGEAVVSFDLDMMIRAEDAALRMPRAFSRGRPRIL